VSRGRARGADYPPLVQLPHPTTQRSSANYPNPERTSEDRVRAAVAEAWRYYTLDKLHDRGVAYLAKRGIDVTDLEAVTGTQVVGRIPHQGWPATRLANHLRKKGFTDEEMLDAGLATQTRSGVVVDAYRDRVLLPVLNEEGRPIALIGQYIGKRDDVPKYLNPSRTVTYDKSKNLYRPNPTSLDPDGQVVVVEGTLDALHLAAVAAQTGRLSEFAPVTSSGLALRPEQVATVVAMSERPVVLAADGDAPGAKANVDWATALLAAGRQSAIVSLPPDPDTHPRSDGSPAGYDPDTWLARHGEEGLLTFTRRGGEAAPPEDVRPRPSHRAVAERLMSSSSHDPVKATLEPLGRLSGTAARRYATTSADVLAPKAVPQALKVAGHTHDGWTNPAQWPSSWQPSGSSSAPTSPSGPSGLWPSCIAAVTTTQPASYRPSWPSCAPPTYPK